MDSRRKFVFIYTVLSLATFTYLTFLGETDIGLYAISFIIIYFFLRLALSPRFRSGRDILSYILFVAFVLLISTRVIAILFP